MEKLIQDYLSAPNERRDYTIERMLVKPEEAFDALISFRGPYPDGLDVVDVYPDYIQPLLSELIKRVPRLLLERDISKVDPGQRWVLVCAAIEAANAQFAPIILAALQYDEDSGQDLAIKAVARFPFLRTPEAKAQLLKLASLESMSYLNGEIKCALDSFADAENRK
jgi:hypothetical protein